MSTIYATLHEKWKQARLQRLELVATLYSTYASDIQMIGKDAGREVTDADAIAVLKKHLKGVEETIGIINQSVSRTNLPPLMLERDLITELLPKQLDESTIRSVIRDNGLTSIKDAVAYFKHHYPGQYDGKLVSGVFR